MNKINLHSPEKFFGIPLPLPIYILSFLKGGELAKAAQVCKDWYHYSRDASLWEREIHILQIKGDFKTAIKQKVLELRETVKKSNTFILKQVKIARELDQMALPLITENNLSVDDERTLEEAYNQAVDEKLEYSDQMKMGFDASFTLYKLGLIQEEVPFKYADRLLEKCRDDRAFLRLGLYFVTEGKTDKALEIVKTKLVCSYEKGHIISRLVTLYSQKNDLAAAVELIKEFKEDEYFKESYHYEECCSLVLSYAKQNNDWDTVELVIDSLTELGRKFLEVKYLIEHFLEKNDYEPAEKVFQKNFSLLSAAKENYEIHILIELYVRLGRYEQAKKLAMENKEKDRIVLYVLRNAYDTVHRKDLAEEIEKMLPKKEDLLTSENT